MSKKKQTKKAKPTDPSTTDSPESIVASALSVATVAEVDFETVSATCLQFAESARDASQPQLAASAERLSQLAELANADAQGNEGESALAEQVCAFLRENAAKVLDPSQSDDDVLRSVDAEAFERWGSYLEAFQEFPIDGDDIDNAWGDAFGDDSAPEASDDPGVEELGDYGSQIDAMLSAIDGLETTTEPAGAPPEEMFASSDTANEGAAADDSAAIADLRADREMLEAYLDDANNCVASMEQSVLQLESNPNQPEPVRQFCRELHTLKGASATVGLAGLATFLHNLESSLEKQFDGDQCTAEPDALMQAVDTVRERIDALSATAPTVQVSTPTAGNHSAAAAPRVNLGNTAGDEASIRIRASKLDRLMDMLAELVVLRNRRESHVTEFNRLNEELTRCSTRLRFASEETGLADTEAGSLATANSTTGEIARDLAEFGNELRSLQKPISTDNLAISRFVRDFRQELMQLRRMPVSGLFQRLQRVARDAGKIENKLVQVEMLGAETGLEQELQESLYEPLIHIVRNAVGHGLETPAGRKQNGKLETGRITLEAKASSQLLVIEVSDDGNGLDYDAVAKRARDKGLIAAHATPSESELAKLIFHPGFSTREQVSELSGRGVGMDVVATAINQLHGRIEILSQRGKGTTMRLTIPLRSGIEHVMVFRTAGQLFALPMQAVQMTQELSANDTAGTSHDLADVLSLRRTAADRGRHVIVMRDADRSLNKNQQTQTKRQGFVVDDIIGPEEVVVRALPVFLKQHPLLCGVTLSGTSETVLLIDGGRLNEFCESNLSNGSDESRDNGASFDDGYGARTVLVVDDSLSARKNLARKLTAAGYTTTEAGDGLAALEALRKNTFDLIFTDLDMPQMGGLELLADLQRGPHRDIPVVVVSGRAEQEFRDRATEAGAADYLVKPATVEQLNSILDRLTLEPENA